MKRFSEPIYVTRPYFPPLEDFSRGCAEIWANRWLSNNGPILQKFHRSLAAYLSEGETNLALFNNGTSALELAYQAADFAGGEVITTPFTFVATSHALVRSGAKPVFADIDPDTLCLDPAKCAELVRPGVTRGIVPVHVYGHVCDVAGFAELGRRNGLKVVYDAAHAFGIPGIARHGDLSMFSLHPTKLFHSAEGGLLVFRNPALQTRFFELRDFGIRSEEECVEVGTNAKMNEFQALMGLECLKRIDDLLAHRREVHAAYASVLAGRDGVRLLEHSQNHAYEPVLFADRKTRDRVYEGLKAANVFARKYFFPLLTDFAPYAYARGTCPVAEDAAVRVLTLPTYFDLPAETAAEIAQLVRELI